MADLLASPPSSPAPGSAPEQNDAAPAADLEATDDRGTLVIADKVVERIASIAATEVDPVTHTGGGWTRITGGTLPKATAKVAGGRARVAIEVAVTWPNALAGVAAGVREHVTAQLKDLTGMTIDAVDVTVADIVHSTTAIKRRVQ